MNQRPIRSIRKRRHFAQHVTNEVHGWSPGAAAYLPRRRLRGHPLCEHYKILYGIRSADAHPSSPISEDSDEEYWIPMAGIHSSLLSGLAEVEPEPVDTLESFMAPNGTLSEASRAGTDEPPAKRVKLESPDPRERVHQSEPAESTNSDPFGTPTVQLSGISGTFVISLGFLKQQSLASLVRSYYRTARWVEADFSNPNLLSSLGLASRCPDIDMVLAPNIALMTTTVARLHQRPIPETVPKPNLLSSSWCFDPAAYMPPDAGRIVRTVPFYRRTILLVSQGLPASYTSPVKLSRDDKDAMQEFRHDLRVLGLGKAQGSRGDVKLEYCAGGERELAKWVVAMMVQYGHGGWRPGGREGWAEMEE